MITLKLKTIGSVTSQGLSLLDRTLKVMPICVILMHYIMTFSSLSNCTEQSSTQEISHITCLLKVHYPVNEGPQIVPVLSHFNSFHTLPPYFLNNFSVIHLCQHLLSGLFLSGLLIKLIYIYFSHIPSLYSVTCYL